MFNIEYMLNLFWINNTQGRELCWHDFLTYVFNAIICQDTFEQICFVLGMMLSTIEVYSLIPVGMTMMFTQGHRVMVMGNLELVQSFCSRVAWSSSIVHDGWLSKGDDCDEVLSVWWIWIVWAFAVLVCSVNINYEKNLTAALATIFVCLSELLFLCVFVCQTVQWLTVTLLAEYPKQPIQTPLMTKAGGDSLCLQLKVMGRAF